MRRLLVILATALMVFSFSMVGFAYSPDATATAYQTGKMGQQLTCGPGERYSGEIAWVQPDAQSMMVNGRDGSKIFDLSKATLTGLPEANEFVSVNYTVVNGDRIVSSVTVVPQRMASLYVGDF